MTELGGVLILDGKTYGRYKDKLLYKCMPFAPDLPSCLIPYEERTKTFSKYKINKYISFRIDNLIPPIGMRTPPIGMITNVIGDVDNIDAYTNYQLLVNGLNSSLKTLNAATVNSLREKSLFNLQDHKIADRRTWKIISIDPEGCTDIDDAIGLKQDETGVKNNELVLSIYIANVPMVLENLNLWSVLSDRISTIYLKDKKIPMLPPILSDDRCSLLQGEDRIALALDVHINTITKSILKYSHQTVVIRVEKNYVYENAELLSRLDYQTILKLGENLNRTLRYVSDLSDSHQLIEFCMILMNYECSQILLNKNRGIFRSASKNKADMETSVSYNIPLDCKHILQNIVGEYCSVAEVKPHELMGCDDGGLPTYVHITSPIRRLVDCLNMLEIQRDTLITSREARQFLEKWLDKIPYINEKNKAIRRLQNDVALLHLYQPVYTQPVYTQPVYIGMVFAQTSPKADLFKYRVYIPVIKCLTSVYSSIDVPNYSFKNFTLHWFLDESKMHKKMRLQMV